MATRPPDLVKRQVTAQRPNELWLADITYCSTLEGWLYVAFVLDVYSRQIVGWQVAGHVRTDVVLDALEMAIWRRDEDDGSLIHHSDAGSQPGFNFKFAQTGTSNAGATVTASAAASPAACAACAR